MIMTGSELALVPTDELMQRKRDLENGLAAASMHGVEIPEDMLKELTDTQIELAKRLDCSPNS